MSYKKLNIKQLESLEPTCKKAIYNTQEEALEMIAYIKATRVVREISAYKCTICGFWHLTSRIK